jgi:hypothetical protein
MGEEAQGRKRRGGIERCLLNAWRVDVQAANSQYGERYDS